MNPSEQKKKNFWIVVIGVVGLIALSNQSLTVKDPENTYPKRIKRALRLFFDPAENKLEEHLIGKGIDCENPVDLYREAAAATVVVKTDKGFGAGVFIGPELIVTAKHVVDGTNVSANLPNVRDGNLAKPGRSIPVDQVIRIDGLDLAFIKTRGRNRDWLLLQNGVPEDSELMVVGHPNGKYYSLQKGRIKKKGRLENTPFVYFKDNEVFFGNSGGTIISCEGRLVGVVSMMSDYDNSLLKQGIGINARTIAKYADKNGLSLPPDSKRAETGPSIG